MTIDTHLNPANANKDSSQARLKHFQCLQFIGADAPRRLAKFVREYVNTATLIGADAANPADYRIDDQGLPAALLNTIYYSEVCGTCSLITTRLITRLTSRSISCPHLLTRIRSMSFIDENPHTAEDAIMFYAQVTLPENRRDAYNEKTAADFSFVIPSLMGLGAAGTAGYLGMREAKSQGRMAALRDIKDDRKRKLAIEQSDRDALIRAAPAALEQWGGATAYLLGSHVPEEYVRETVREGNAVARKSLSEAVCVSSSRTDQALWSSADSRGSEARRSWSSSRRNRWDRRGSLHRVTSRQASVQRGEVHEKAGGSFHAT